VRTRNLALSEPVGDGIDDAQLVRMPSFR